MNRIAVVVIAAFMVIFLALFALRSNDRDSETQQSVVLYCAASNRAVIEACCREYQKSTGRSVQVQYGASQTLLSSIEVSGVGDLFLPADDSYLDIARERSLVTQQRAIATMRAVVAVQKGNPKSIASLEDLMRSDVRLIQANPDAAAIGKVVRDSFTRTGKWDALAKATVAFRTSVTDVANDLVINAADAGIVYDVVLHSYPDLQAVSLPELDEVTSRVSISLLACSQRPEAATHFMNYLTDKDGGLMLYAEYGFDTANAK
jgi:molybdate transport system substrate-binding protein